MNDSWKKFSVSRNFIYFRKKMSSKTSGHTQRKPRLSEIGSLINNDDEGYEKVT